MTGTMEPVEAEVDGYESQCPCPQRITGQIDDSVLLINPCVEENIESGKEDPEIRIK